MISFTWEKNNWDLNPTGMKYISLFTRLFNEIICCRKVFFFFQGPRFIYYSMMSSHFFMFVNVVISNKKLTVAAGNEVNRRNI